MISPHTNIPNALMRDYLADCFAGAVNGGWSLFEKLSKYYSGPLFTVRRSSDNALRDIFAAGRYVDMLQLIDFIGSDSAFVTRVYGQIPSVNGLFVDLIQTTDAQQPRIANAGVLDTLGNAIPGAQGTSTTNIVSVNGRVDDFNYFQSTYGNGGTIIYVGRLGTFTGTFAAFNQPGFSFGTGGSSPNRGITAQIDNGAPSGKVSLGSVMNFGDAAMGFTTGVGGVLVVCLNPNKSAFAQGVANGTGILSIPINGNVPVSFNVNSNSTIRFTGEPGFGGTWGSQGFLQTMMLIRDDRSEAIRELQTIINTNYNYF